MNSKQKGKRGELEFAHFLESFGYTARRGQQFCGSPDSPDIISNYPAHFEIKRVERLNIYAAMNQAIADSGNEKMPIVAHRRNNGEWLLTLRATDYFSMNQSGSATPISN